MSDINPVKGKKILIIHYRVGRTDGVSLQIAAWKEILESKGAQVLLCSGPENIGADYVIKDLEQQLNPEIFTIDEDAFGGLKTCESNQQLNQKIKQLQVVLTEEFMQVLHHAQPDYLIVSNLFSVGENIPATLALYQAIKTVQIPTLAVHHDYYWENGRYVNPTNSYIKDIFTKNYPPKSQWFVHACINSLAQNELWKRKNINAALLHDTFDFNQPLWRRTRHHHKLLKLNNIDKNDLVLLQATRIVRRKNIELAIDLVKTLNQKKLLQQLSTSTLYDNRKFNMDRNQIVLILSGYAEFRDQSYLKQLLRYASKSKVNVCLLDEIIYGKKGSDYDFWDAYPLADSITYPSEYEGFGNQFLEAVFAKKPVVLFEYPVWLTDIKPKDFDVISLGKELKAKHGGLVAIPKKSMNQAALQLIKVLTDKNRYEEMVERNFIIGKTNFNYENAWEVMRRVFEKLERLKK
jgi:glycosyltransferase involved in cell wall biosynthesis